MLLYVSNDYMFLLWSCCRVLGEKGEVKVKCMYMRGKKKEKVYDYICYVYVCLESY